jgi:hypothetical protein
VYDLKFKNMLRLTKHRLLNLLKVFFFLNKVLKLKIARKVNPNPHCYEFKEPFFFDRKLVEDALSKIFFKIQKCLTKYLLIFIT